MTCKVTTNSELDATSNSVLETATQVRSEYTFMQFMIGPSNEHAVRSAYKLTDLELQGNPTPLFIYGEIGLGKTHLLHAIANELNTIDSSKRTHYFTSDQYTKRFIKNVRKGAGQEACFNEIFDTDYLLLDDIQFLSGRESVQNEFCSTFDYLHNLGRRIVITSDRPPQDIDSLNPRLLSRLKGGIVAEIQVPGVELRKHLIHTLCTLYTLDNISMDTSEVEFPMGTSEIEFLARSQPISIRELKGVFNTVISKAKYQNKEIDRNLIDEVLIDFAEYT